MHIYIHTYYIYVCMKLGNKKEQAEKYNLN